MKPKRVHRAALVLLTPPVVSIALWGFIFVVGLIVEGWAIMTTPESLADLGLYAVVTTVIFYAIALTVAVVELLARWRKRRGGTGASARTRLAHDPRTGGLRPHSRRASRCCSTSSSRWSYT